MEELERQKLDAIKELAYGASHEINNPLANIAARAQTLLREETQPDRRRSLEAIHQQAMRAHEMISDLMLFARPPQLVCKPFDVRELVSELVAKLAAEAASRQIKLNWKIPEQPILFTGDRQQLYVALSAVCDNALEAIGRDSEISITLGKTDESTAIRVTDNGPGIPSEVREHMFDPFYSGREAGRGLGFGLSKCWRIVTQHGGSVDVESNDELGATITIRLPLE